MLFLFSYFHGLLLGLSLIIAIGAQNLFVFNQGLIGKHVICMFVLFTKDALLILIGYSGVYLIVENNNFLQNLIIFIGFWLISYGILKIKDGLLLTKKKVLIFIFQKYQ